MGYVAKEVFATLQGEGFHTGRVSVFCRFAGCNLWTGREATRASAMCKFCDTDFVGTDGPGGGHFADAASLVDHIAATWPASVPLGTSRHSAETASAASARSGAATGPAGRDGKPFVVCTGGEPLLQLDRPLVDELHDRGFMIAIETNGTIVVPDGVDWVCMSPKAEADVVVTSGDELKLVFPQAGGAPERYADLEFDHFFLQPMDGPERERNTVAAIDYCLKHPQWRLSVQTHKFLGIP